MDDPQQDQPGHYYWMLNLSAYPGGPASHPLPEQLHWKPSFIDHGLGSDLSSFGLCYIGCRFVLTSQHTSASNTIYGQPVCFIHPHNIPDNITSDQKTYLIANRCSSELMLKQFTGSAITQKKTGWIHSGLPFLRISYKANEEMLPNISCFFSITKVQWLRNKRWKCDTHLLVLHIMSHSHNACLLTIWF